MKSVILASYFALVGAVLGQAPTTSLVQLISSPEKFDGKKVRFQAVINIGFENNAAYLSKDHWRNLVTSCGVWLDIPAELAESRKWGSGKYFVIEGIFNAKDRGHMGLWMGAISDVTMLHVHEIVKPEK